MQTKVGLAKHAYTGAPAGYPRTSQPNGEIALDGWLQKRPHWSFDDELKTSSRSSRVPMSANEALNLMEQLLSASQSVGR